MDVQRPCFLIVASATSCNFRAIAPPARRECTPEEACILQAKLNCPCCSGVSSIDVSYLWFCALTHSQEVVEGNNCQVANGSESRVFGVICTLDQIQQD